MVRKSILLLVLLFNAIAVFPLLSQTVIPVSDAVTTSVPIVAGDGIKCDIFLGLGGGTVDEARQNAVEAATYDATLLSPYIDFPSTGNTVTISASSFAGFFSNTIYAPDSVRTLLPSGFILRCTALLKVTKDLDIDTSTDAIDLRIDVGSDDGYRLVVGGNVLGYCGDRGFGWSYHSVSFESEGLYELYFLFSANNSSYSGVDLKWYVNNGGTLVQQFIPQSVLYQTQAGCSYQVEFDDLAAGTALFDQYSSQGGMFFVLGGNIQVTDSYPEDFVPVSGSNVLADPNNPPTEPGILMVSFVDPSDNEPATVRYFSTYVIDAEDDGAVLTAFDVSGDVIDTVSVQGTGGASQYQAVFDNVGDIAYVMIFLGSTTDACALDKMCWAEPQEIMLPDISMDTLTTAVKGWGAGTIATTLTVSNTGKSLVSGFDVSYYLSDDNVLDVDDTYCDIVTIGASIAAGETVVVPVDVQLPDDISGDKWLIAVADEAGAVVEFPDNSSNTVVSSSSFVTATDHEPPVVYSHKPDSLVHPGVSSIEFELSADIDPNTVVADNIYLADPDGIEVELISVFDDADSWVITFIKQKTEGAYTFILSAGITDMAGNPLDGNLDGVGGDDFISGFEITSEPIQTSLHNWEQHGPVGNGNWTVSADGSTVYQSINGNPTFFISDFELTNSRFEGTFSTSDGDDDFMGFVFAFNDLDEDVVTLDQPFYLFQWKQNNQSSGERGFKLIKVINPVSYDYWNAETDANATVLHTNLSVGWVRNVQYYFSLSYKPEEGEMRVIVKPAADSLPEDYIYDSGLIVDTDPLGTGRVGFYNYSQAKVTYSGFSSSALLPPVADAGGPYTFDVNTSEITLSALNSNDPDGTFTGFDGIVDVQWDLGSDGIDDLDLALVNGEEAISIDTAIAKGLTVADYLPVTLTIYDEDNLSSTTTTRIYYSSVMPVIAANGPYGPVDPDGSLTLAGFADDDDLYVSVGESLKIEWDTSAAASASDIGNGFASTLDAEISYADLVNIYKAYGDTIYLNVADAAGLVASVSTVFSIAAPDIKGESAQVGSFVVAGESMDISWSGLNASSVPTPQGKWRDKLILHDNAVYGDGSEYTVLANVNRIYDTAVGRWESYQNLATVNFPSTGVTGQRYLFIELDNNDSLYETNESNNIMGPFPIFIQPAPVADLDVINFEFPATVVTGGTALASWSVLNSGTGVTATTAGVTVDSWVDKVVLSTDTVVSANDIILANASISGPVTPGDSYSNSTTIIIPPTLDAGDYYVILSADVNNNVYEDGIESNNVAVLDHLVSVSKPEGDYIGPKIISQIPSGTIDTEFSEMVLEFNEPINTATLSVADMLLVGPGNETITVNDISVDTNGSLVTISFDTQVSEGQYALRFGPFVADLSGNWMDQNENLYAGEQPEDIYESKFTLIYPETPDTIPPHIISYSPVSSYDSIRYVEVIFSELMDGSSIDYESFIIKNPIGGLISGIGAQYYGNNKYRIYIPEQDSINGEYTLYIQPEMTDTSGNFLDQDGNGIGGEGSDVFSGTITLSIPPDVTGPSVEGYGPTYSNLAISSFDIGFSEPILFESDLLHSSFTESDITVWGPSGEVIPVTVTQQDPHVFTISFSEWTQEGIYTFAVGPDIKDRAGNLMDQNKNGTNGEASDVFNGSVQLEFVYDVVGPVVMSVSPGYVYEELDSIEVRFSEAVKQSTVSTADFELIAPDGSSVTGFALTRVSDTRYRLDFSPIKALGDYVLNIGPYITDVSDNLMNQDQDSINGEPTDDYYSRTIQILGVPDFAISSFNAPTIGDSGDDIEVSYTVSNIGTGALLNGSWNDRIVLSSDNILGNSDDQTLPVNPSGAYNGGLSKGQSYSADGLLVTIPESAHGNYYLFVQTDYSGNITETNEGNNYSVRSINIRKQDIGLNAVDISFNPVSPSESQDFTVSVKVHNYGDDDIVTDVVVYDGAVATGTIIETITGVLVEAGSVNSVTTGAYSIATAGGRIITAVLQNITPDDDVASNNKAARKIIIGPPGYDLDISFSGFDTWVGATLDVPVMLLNSGANQIHVTNIVLSGAAGSWFTFKQDVTDIVLNSNEAKVLMAELNVPDSSVLTITDYEAFSAKIDVITLQGTYSKSATLNVYSEAASTLNITVVEKDTNVPLPNTLVMLGSQQGEFYTDHNGFVAIPAKPGVDELFAYKEDHYPKADVIELAAGDNSYTFELTEGQPLEVQSVNVRPLTGQEVLDRGVDITDPVNNWVFDFEIRLKVESIVVPNIVAPVGGGNVSFVRYVSGGYTGGGGYSGGYTVIGSIEYHPTPIEVEAKTETYIIIPGDVRLLKQFFDVTAVIINNSESPLPELITIEETEAEIKLPNGLALPELFGVPQPEVLPVGDEGVLQAGEVGQASWVVRGDVTGVYQVTVDASGELYFNPSGGDPQHITTLAATGTSDEFEVVEQTIAMDFNGPSMVRSGQEFDIDIVVTNTSSVPAYFVRMGLDARYMQKAHLADGENEARSLGDLEPGESATATYRMVSEVTGIVTFGQILYDSIGSSPVGGSGDSADNNAQIMAYITSTSGIGPVIPEIPEGSILPGDGAVVNSPQVSSSVGILEFGADVADAIGDSETIVLAGDDSSLQFGQEIGDGPYGYNDVDIYKIELTMGTVLHVDIDAQEYDSTLVSKVRLFDDNGVEIVANTNAPDPETGFVLDPAFSEFLPSGIYYICVSSADNDVYVPETADSGTGISEVEANVGPYLLYISKGQELPGDLDGDGDIDLADRDLFNSTFGKYESEAGYISRADLDSDGQITMNDYQTWLELFNQYDGSLGYITGDINRDGQVDLTDKDLFMAAFGKYAGQAGYNYLADVYPDGVISVRDYQIWLDIYNAYDSDSGIEAIVIDDIIDMSEFADIAANWMASDCSDNCNGGDFSGDHSVDYEDLYMLLDSWLK